MKLNMRHSGDASADTPHDQGGWASLKIVVAQHLQDPAI